jgi:hypothetical protein
VTQIAVTYGATSFTVPSRYQNLRWYKTKGGDLPTAALDAALKDLRY